MESYICVTGSLSSILENCQTMDDVMETLIKYNFKFYHNSIADKKIKQFIKEKNEKLNYNRNKI